MSILIISLVMLITLFGVFDMLKQIKNLPDENQTPLS
jgi:hypothetical protein